MNHRSPLDKGPLVTAALFAVLALVVPRDAAVADEGDVSFWLPETFGSLAAVPGQPGLGCGFGIEPRLAK